MTGEQICQISTEELEAMSDEQLLAYFAPILKITRPSEVIREAGPDETVGEVRKAPKVKRAAGNQKPSTNDMLAQLLSLAKAQGIDLEKD